EDADRHRHFLLMNEVVEDRRHTEASFWIDVRPAVLEDHDAGRLFGIVLGRYIDPIIAGGSRIDGAGPAIFGDLPFGYFRMFLRVGAELVIVGGIGRDKTRQPNESDAEKTRTH